MVTKIRKSGSKRLLAVVMTMFMAFAFMPAAGTQPSYAASPAQGGTVIVDTTAEAISSAEDAFGSDAADVSTAGDTLTITLNDDVALNGPVQVMKGTSGKTLVLDLNGKTLTAKAGEAGYDSAAAKGSNAIEIIAADYDVCIKGPGSIIGGEGAVYETENHMRYGADGGMAICFAGNADGSYWNPTAENGRLEHGLTVTGDAVISGGTGAEMSGNDWLHNIEKYDGGDKYDYLSCPQFELQAGAGGAGIGQTDTGVPYGASTVSYAKILIENGTVTGGAGGGLDMGTADMPVLTHYSLMNDPAIISCMDAVVSDDNSYYDEYVSGNIQLAPGQGGDGIMIGAGRKYVCVEKTSAVTGGGSGSMDYGKSRLVNRIVNHAAEAGNGITVYGDVGLTDAAVDNANWDNKGKASDDMGIFIAGSVTGGSSLDAYAMNENAGNAGSGLVLHGEKEYFTNNDRGLVFPAGEDYINWGIIGVADTGIVSGGCGGKAVSGESGAGGEGLLEAYTKGEDVSDDSPIGTDYFLINGQVTGGNGGDSVSKMTETGMIGCPGYPGNGISFSNYRKNVCVFGNGTATGGNWGSMVHTAEEDLNDETMKAKGIRFYPEDREYNNNTVADTITETAGGLPTRTQVDNTGLKVKASMTSFKDYPTTATVLSCKVDKPSDYSGSVYIKWSVKLTLQSNEPEYCDIEPSGADSSSFNLCSNDQYKYLAYEGAYLTGYNLDIATTDRIKETIKHTNSNAVIRCCVVLEDGRWAQSDPMKFTSEGWEGSGSDPDPTDEDRQAAQNVQDMIEALPPVSEIVLSDADQIAAARDAYEALTEDQKYLVGSEELNKLRDAVASINKLLAEEEQIAVPDPLEYIDISTATITVPDAVYTGKELKPEPTVTLDGETLKIGKHYTCEYENNINAGDEAVIKIIGQLKYQGEITKTFSILKKENTLSAEGKTVKVKAKSLKKKKKTLNVTKTINFKDIGQGELTYKLLSVKKPKFKKFFKVDGLSGKITIKKKLKKGKYKLNVQITAAETENCTAGTKSVTIKIKVR